MSYVNLHAHTSFSDAMGTTESLVKEAADHDQPAYAITDHGTVSGWLEFQRACKEEDIKPIFGVEAYVMINRVVGHMTLLAKSRTGMHNIMRLVTDGHILKRKQRAITIGELTNRYKDVVVLTGCPGSPLLALPKTERDAVMSDLMSRFKDNLYLEIMPHGHMRDYVAQIITFMRDYRDRIPFVATNDIHYAKPEYKEAHMLIQEDIRRYTYDNDNLHNRGISRFTTDLKNTFGDYFPNGVIIDAIQNTRKIANQVEDIEIKEEIELPVDSEEVNKMINAAANKVGTIERFADIKTYAERFLYEWEVISANGYGPYFYIVKELVDFARRKGIRVGPGRGSGAGSLVLYLLGITEIDPIRYNLLFERFLNPARQDWPDVDVDFDSERRNEVIEYAAKRWGAAPITTRIRYSHKSLVRGIAKVYNVPKATADIASNKPTSAEFDELMSFPGAKVAYEQAMDQIRHAGKHAGGIVMSPKWLPRERISDDTLAVPWGSGLRSDDLTPVGLIKFDLLGISSLASLSYMERISGVKAGAFGECIGTMQTIAEGDTMGVFQMSSGGIRNLAKKVNPKTGEDISAILALYRPGPLDSGMADEYPKLEYSPRLIHPLVDPILAETRGIIVYQEQMMRVFQTVTGLTAVDAENLRKIVSKKWTTDPRWKIYEKAFIEGCVDKLDKRPMEAAQLWSEIASFELYGFNKSHSLSYAHITYQTAWHKTHNPVAFYTAQMQYDTNHLMPFIFEAVESGIEVRSPHVNYSSHEFTTDGDTIYMPLTSVFRIGEKAASIIVKERETNGPYKNLLDFQSRLPKAKVNKGHKLNLMAVNAFEGLGNAFITTLGVDTDKFLAISKMGKAQRQLTYLKMHLPTQELIDKIKSINSSSTVDELGLVQYAYQGENKTGEFTLLTVAPSGANYYFNEKVDFMPGELLTIHPGRYTTYTKMM